MKITLPKQKKKKPSLLQKKSSTFLSVSPKNKRKKKRARNHGLSTTVKTESLVPASTKRKLFLRAKQPKRKQKVLLKRFLFRLGIFFSLFTVSVVLLFVICFSPKTILSPIPGTVSHVLGPYTEKNNQAFEAQVKEQLQKHNIAFISVAATDTIITVQLSDATQAILSVQKDIATQIDSLQVTMDNLTIEDKRISRIDMRFARPVVTFQ